MSEATGEIGSAVTSVDTLADADSDTLKAINQAVVYQAPQGKFNCGPVVDGDYVTNIPQVSLLNGDFDASLAILTSHTANESLPFVPTTVATTSDVEAYLVSNLPSASTATIDYILDTLYPTTYTTGAYLILGRLDQPILPAGPHRRRHQLRLRNQSPRRGI